MKGNKPKVSASQSQLTDYELQRIQKLKSNAERMKAQGSGSLANKILEEKTKALFTPSARQNNMSEDRDDESTSDYDGENEVETMEVDNLVSGKRKVCKQVSKKLYYSSVRPQNMGVVEMNNQKKHSCIQGKQQDQQVVVQKRGKKDHSVLLVPSLIQNDDDALNENNINDVLNASDDDNGLNENANAAGTDFESDQELEDKVIAQFAREEIELASKTKKHQGPTMLPKVHARTREEHPVIVLNKFGQPVGPTKEIVTEFKFFLGTVARDSELAPLNYIKFPSLPTLDKIWEYVLDKYMVPQAGFNWVMGAINACWKAHKRKTKKLYFYAYPTDDLRWEHKPDTISEPQFRDLLQYWHTKEAEEISKVNKDNRLMLDDMHNLGRKSFAILRHELQQQDPDKQEPSQAKVYKESRKRVVGRTYLTNYEKAKENIAKMEALESSKHEDGNNSKDPYSEVIPDPKRKSRVRLHGKGVKKADLKEKAKKSDFIFPEEFLASMQAQLVQQLAPSITTAVLTQLQEANPEINLEVLDFVMPLVPNDASSAPHQLTNQTNQNGQSKSGATVNQVHDELDGDEVH